MRCWDIMNGMDCVMIKGELEYIILAGEGDTAIENQDEDAQKIASWLRRFSIKNK